jgi:tetratricopeptide (TPR) repeat protein
MSNNISQTERLIGFIDGNITDAEKALLQKELEADKAMQQELDNLLLATELVKNYGLTTRVAGIHKKMMNELAASPVTEKAVVRNLPKLFVRYAAAVILLLGVFGIYQYFTVSANKLYREQYSKYLSTTFRGAETGSAIEKAYAEGKYDEVIAGFKQLSDASINESFLAGQAYLTKEDYAAAINCFKKVITKNNSAHTGILYDDAEYYLALSYLKSNKSAEALPLFKKIHNDKEHLYNNKVSGWFLKKLQLLKWKEN